MSSTLKFIKAVPSEIINVGDVIQLDHKTGLVQRAILESSFKQKINTRLVIGVCIWSDNETPLNIVIDGGKSKNITRTLLDSGTSSDIQTIIIYGGDSTISERQIIQVGYTGEYWLPLNSKARIRLGDKVCISDEPGKVQSLEFYRNIYNNFNMNVRGIGKATKIDKNKGQVRVLLNIE